MVKLGKYLNNILVGIGLVGNVSVWYIYNIYKMQTRFYLDLLLFEFIKFFYIIISNSRLLFLNFILGKSKVCQNLCFW